VSALRCMVPGSCCIKYADEPETTNLFCSGTVLCNSQFLTNINTNGCSDAVAEIAELAINVLCGILIGITIILAINLILVELLIYTIKKEMALFNAKLLENCETDQLKD
jgi:hypothetical protein